LPHGLDGPSELFAVQIMTRKTGVLRALRSLEAATIPVASAVCVTAPTRPAAPPPRPETRVFAHPLRDQPPSFRTATGTSVTTGRPSKRDSIRPRPAAA
jgi:hypothetical protein